MNKLVVGCGYLGQRVANAWKNQGNDVFVVTRNTMRAKQFLDSGFTPIVADITESFSFDSIPQVDTVLFAVGFDRTTGDTIHNVYVNGLTNTLNALAMQSATQDQVPRFIYISSTGVYGQSANEWVDEESPCTPKREGGRACLAAENVLSEHPFGANRVILRLAGIYGPDRIPRLADLKQTKTIAVNGGSYLNLIHVDDASEIVLASVDVTSPKTIVVADGVPVLRRDFYEYAAQLLGVRVEFTDVRSGASARQRSEGGKRCRVDRMRSEIAVDLQFPTFRHGLKDILGGT